MNTMTLPYRPNQSPHRRMSKSEALRQSRPSRGQLWRELSTGILWRITGRNKEGHTIARVGSRKCHTMKPHNLHMFYEPVTS